MIRAWVKDGLLYLGRNRRTGSTVVMGPDGIMHPAGIFQPEYAVEVDGHVVWLPHDGVSDIDPFIDLEKSQIELGFAWPPREKPKAL